MQEKTLVYCYTIVYCEVIQLY
uniref:Uncharacterized protein n=1 Tax=Anguilla anguilla TaxID=7936 RepID=A0A0E9S9P7_ANGAN